MYTYISQLEAYFCMYLTFHIREICCTRRKTLAYKFVVSFSVQVIYITNVLCSIGGRERSFFSELSTSTSSSLATIHV